MQSLTLHPDMWIREGSEYGVGAVTGYRVGGMHDGTTARIANFGARHHDDWRVMRISGDNSQTHWTGNYESLEAALADLQ